MDSKKSIHLLYAQYLANKISKDDLALLLDQLASMSTEELALLTAKFHSSEQISDLKNTEFNSEKTLAFIQDKIVVEEPRKRNKFTAWNTIIALAASISIFLLFKVIYQKDSSLFRATQDSSLSSISNQAYLSLILPSGEALHYSKDLQLLSNNSLALPTKDVKINVLEKGQLAFEFSYEFIEKFKNKTYLIATGSQASCTIRLMDGTLVNMNGKSSIQLPTIFSKEFRTIALQGEAFFDVSHHKTWPFKISAKETEITVLGTSFNVKAYQSDSHALTSLSSGSVALDNGTHQVKLTPGMEGYATNSKGEFNTRKISIQEIGMWRSGFFTFHEEPIIDIIQKLAQWYDIDDIQVVNDHRETFSGSLSKDKSLTQILKQLEKVSNSKFEITERRILIMR